ncbi:MAG: Fic family protein [Candidatus Brocadiaceae bacterium]|nr:Fic family protein [Candidatus Brocadiaceae bacterium]
MARSVGTYRQIRVGGENVRAFVPYPLPPENPPLRMEGPLEARHTAALAALSRLNVAGAMVPSPEWFLYGFVRKEAVISSQIEGTQATLMDALTYEATHEAERPAEVAEVCNYVDALAHARRELARANAVRLDTRLLCAAHARLMRGARGLAARPGSVRTAQNWVGGATPALASFVPPPPEHVPAALARLERWIHADDPLPPLVRTGLAHVQFETIHPFLDGNGRIGRLLIALLMEHWGLLSLPLLYLSLGFRRRRQEYYARLAAVRTHGDWEGWTAFYLECVREAADDGLDAAQRLFTVIGRDRRTLLGRPDATVTALRLCDRLPEHPIVTLAAATQLLDTTKPTAAKAIEVLRRAGILRETTGRRRNRAYAYDAYLKVLSEDTATGPHHPTSG